MRTPDPPLRVLLADDCPALLRLLPRLLELDGTVAVVGCARDAAEAAELRERTRPDVILLDLRLDRAPGYPLTRALARPPGGPPVVALATGFAPEDVAALAAAGAAAILAKSAGLGEMLQTLRAAARADAALAVDPARAV